jgi:predicted restriction endonuclease
VNGLLLRSDIHTLLDRGYVTVTPDLRFEVSRRIKDEFENGRDYYALQGKPVAVPEPRELAPSREYLDWHATHVFRG